jgi:hypothetical protein
MNETEGWTIIGCTFFIVVLVIVLCSQSYYTNINNKIAEMVKNGADPIECAVALDNIYIEKAVPYYLTKNNNNNNNNKK